MRKHALRAKLLIFLQISADLMIICINFNKIWLQNAIFRRKDWHTDRSIDPKE